MVHGCGYTADVCIDGVLCALAPALGYDRVDVPFGGSLVPNGL